MGVTATNTMSKTGTYSVAPSFAVFYRETYGRVAAALRATLNDDDLGIEAADEAMTRCYAQWQKIGHYDNPAGWVYRVGLNWARSAQRRLARRRRLHPEGNVYQPDVPDPAIAAALSRLDDRHRPVVVTRVLLDFSVKETATVLGIREGTVKSRLHRALAQLQQELSHLDHTTGEHT